MDLSRGTPVTSTTWNTTHEVVVLDGSTYFIAQYPEGDFFIHGWNPRKQGGYCGQEKVFLLRDGSFRAVKGPYQMSPSFRDHAALVQHLSRPELNKRARRFKVGRTDNTVSGYSWKMKEVVYEEAVLTLGPIVPKIRSEWHDLNIEIYTRDEGTMYTKVSYFLRTAGDDPVENCYERIG